MPQENNYLHLRKISYLTPLMQIVIVAALFTAMTVVGYQQYIQTGQMFGYPLSISLLFVPIYEEIIFRGFILQEMQNLFSNKKAWIISCILFGLWHLKNIFWLSPMDLLSQIVFAGMIFAPIAIYLTVKTKSIWPAVILPYLNNLIAGIGILNLLQIIK